MIRRIAIALLTAVLAMPAYAGFDEVLDGLHARLGHTTWIPFFSFIRAGIWVIHPDGVHDIQLAVFEGKGSFDVRDADRLMRTRIGNGYSPMVRVRSKKDHEWSFIYAQPSGQLMDLVVLTNDGSDTVLVRVVVDPAQVDTYLDRKRRKDALIARR